MVTFGKLAGTSKLLVFTKLVHGLISSLLFEIHSLPKIILDTSCIRYLGRYIVIWYFDVWLWSILREKLIYGLKNTCNLVNFWLISKFFFEFFFLEKYLKTGDDKFTFTGRFILLFFVSSIFSLSITQIKFVRFIPFKNYEIILNSRIFLTTVFFFKFFKQIFQKWWRRLIFVFIRDTSIFVFERRNSNLPNIISKRNTRMHLLFWMIRR